MSNKTLNIILWVFQVILGLMFIFAGFMKASTPVAELQSQMAWVEDVKDYIAIIGVLELLGGIGLILPSALRIKPLLTVYAAYGIILTMICAAILHINRGEFPDMVTNIVIILIMVFIVWGRRMKVPIEAKK